MESDFTYELFRACQDGDVFYAINMIQNGADINATHGSMKETLLHVAVRFSHSRIVATLLQAGINASIGDSSQVCPIHIASQSGQCQILESLIKAGSEVDAQDESGKSALHFAVDGGETECLKLLLSYGASVNLCDAKGFPALYYATFRGTKDIVAILLAAGADVSRNFSVWSHHMASCPLQFSAATLNKDDILEAYVKSGRINLDVISPVDQNTLLTAAVDGDRLNQVVILLENGANANARRLDLSTALHVAVEKRSELYVKILLSAGANANIKNCNGWSAFELCISDLNSLVHQVVDSSALLIFKLLISCGADLSDLNVFTRQEAQMFLSGNPEVMYMMYEMNCSFPREILLDFPDSHSYNRNEHIHIVLDKYSHPICLQQMAANAIRAILQPFLFISIDKITLPDSMKKYILLSSYL